MKIAEEWLALLMVFFMGTGIHLLNVASKGEPMSPLAVTLRLLAQGLVTGVAAAVVWSALTIKWQMPLHLTVAVAGTVAFIGVDLGRRWLILFAEKKLGIEKKAGVENESTKST